MELKVPPDIPPLTECIVIDVPTLRGVGRDLSVLFARCAEISEGTESYPHEGTMMEPVLLAMKSYLWQHLIGTQQRITE